MLFNGLRVSGVLHIAVLCVCIAVIFPDYSECIADDKAFVPYTIVDGASIPESLTGKPGDSDRGKSLFYNTNMYVGGSSCSDCHGSSVRSSSGGDVAILLKDAGSFYSEGQLRLIISNIQVINPDSIMPVYYSNELDSNGNYVNKPLSAQDIEDIIAYVMNL